MAESTTGGDLRRHLKLAKEIPVSFAFNPGNAVEEHLFLLHRKKSPDVLGKTARKEGPGRRFTCGTCQLADRILDLTLSKEMPQVAKRVKVWLSAQKVKLNVRVLGPDGEVLESDIEDLPPDDDLDGDDAPTVSGEAEGGPPARTEETAETPAPQADPRKAKWEATAAKLGPAVDTVLGQGLTDDKKLEALWNLARSKAQARDYATALKAVAPIMDLIKKASEPDAGTGASDETPAAAAEDPAKAKWDAAAGKMAPRIEAISTLASATKIVAAWNKCQAMADGGNYVGAMAILAKIVVALKSVRADKPDSGLATLIARLKALSEDVKAALAADPSRKAELLGHLKTAKEFLTAKDEAGAARALEALQEALSRPSAAPSETAPVSGADAQQAAKAARAIWVSAKDKVDIGIGKIQAALRSYDDEEDFVELADKGLAGFTGQLQTGLMTSLMDLEGTSEAGAEKATTKALDAIADFEKFVSGNEVVLGLDDNPFGVTVNARQTFGQALAEMKSTLSAAQRVSA